MDKCEQNLIKNKPNKTQFLENYSKIIESELISGNLAPNISVIKKQITDKLLLSEKKYINPKKSSVPTISSTPKMSSKRELSSLKSEFKQSIGKSGKRTSTQTQILDISHETKPKSNNI